MTDAIIAYHFLQADMTSPHAPRYPWRIGQKRTLRGGDIIPCRRGYHGSPTSFDAIEYAPGPVLCRVELSGDVMPHGNPIDKYAARSRKLLAAVNAERELCLFAADCAEHVLPIFEAAHPGDDRPRAAIQAARDYANGLIGSDELRTAAAYAADDAAHAAARAAAYAAYAADDASATAADAAHAYAAYAANIPSTIASAYYSSSYATYHAAARAWQRERWDHYAAHLFEAVE